MDPEKIGFHMIFDSYRRDVDNVVGAAASKVVVDNQRLIECVKMHEELYVSSHTKSTDNRHKDAIWDNIAMTLGIPASLCKRSWFNLRDSYRRVLRKRREAIHDKLPYHKWRYDDQMSFLAPHISIRESKDYLLRYDMPSQAEDSLNVSSENTNSGNSTATGTSPVSDSIEKLPPSKKKRETTYAQYAMAGSYSPQNISTDHIDAFLIGIGATLKNFTPYNQSLAKMKIFALVSEMEMQQIVERKGQAASNSPPSPPIIEEVDAEMIEEQEDKYNPAENNYLSEESESRSCEQIDECEQVVTKQENVDKKDVLDSNYYNTMHGNYYPNILPFP